MTLDYLEPRGQTHDLAILALEESCVSILDFHELDPAEQLVRAARHTVSPEQKFIEEIK